VAQRTLDLDATLEPTGGEGASAEIPPHRLVGRYEVGELLGRGGGGQVHQALDVLTGEQVAVKFVRAMSPGERLMLRRERAALRLLSLPGVVRLLDEGEEGGQSFLVMELLSGGTLDRLAGPFPRWKEAARALLETLGRVHHAGFLHRDLKPANVLLDAGGQPVLTDFGLAEVADEAPSLPEGTPSYMAPEQRQGLPCDVRADLYAVGAILWELAAGARLPQPPPTTLEAPTVPEALREVILRCLRPVRQDRPESVEEVLAAFGDGGLAVPKLPAQVEVADLEKLFQEPPRSFLHLAQDAAAELHLASRGQGPRAREILQRWIRAGRVILAPEGLMVDRRAIGALRWERSEEAQELARLGRTHGAEALAERALEVAARARAQGDLSRALTVLESVLPAVEDSGEVRRALAADAITLGDTAARDLALYRAQRADDRELVGVLHGARLLASGEMERGLALLRGGPQPEEAIERQRLGLIVLALGRLAPTEQRQFLDELEGWAAEQPERRALLSWWRGTAAYTSGAYREALALHEDAMRALAGAEPGRMAVLLPMSAAAAAMELGDPGRAVGYAARAQELADQLRLPLPEAKASWLLRAAKYRSGAPLAPDPDLVEAAGVVSPLLEAQLALVEAAFAWRAGQRPLAAGLAERAASSFGRIGFSDGRALSLGLWAASGGEPGEEVVLAVLQCREPTVALQALALCPPLVPHPEVPRWAAAWHLPPDARADVLTLEECLARLRATPALR
jgi:hypothetical protein